MFDNTASALERHDRQGVMRSDNTYGRHPVWINRSSYDGKSEANDNGVSDGPFWAYLHSLKAECGQVPVPLIKGTERA